MTLGRLTKFNVNGKMACIGSEIGAYLKLKNNLNESYLNSRGLMLKHDYDVIDSCLLNNRVSTSKQRLLKDRKTIVLYTSGIERIITNRRQSESIDLAKQLNIPLSYIKEREYMTFLKDALRDYECVQQYPVKRLDGGYYFVDMVVFEKNSDKARPLLCVECDEFNHIDRDMDDEASRQSFIENVLQCSFYRFNPDSKKFSLGLLIADIYDKINSISSSDFQTKYTLFEEDALEELMMDEVNVEVVNAFIEEYISILTYELETKEYECHLKLENTTCPKKSYITYKKRRLIDIDDIVNMVIIPDSANFIKIAVTVKYQYEEKRETLLIYEISKNQLEIKTNNSEDESNSIISEYIKSLNLSEYKE